MAPSSPPSAGTTKSNWTTAAATGYPRGKKSLSPCGDEVSVELSPDGQITGHGVRRAACSTAAMPTAEADRRQRHAVAAGGRHRAVLQRHAADARIVAAEHQGLRTTIVLNKCDLAAALPAARKLLAPFVALGCRVVELRPSAMPRPCCRCWPGESSVLVGQSGMGKSTLTNALVPGAAAAVRETLHRARQRQAHHHLRPPLPARDARNGTLIDSPGLQEFGLKHLTPQEIEYGFAEFRPFLGQCRFRDCQHDAEPGCAIKDAVAPLAIHPRRLDHFHQFISENRHGSH
jgi:ribosome biogenesis GTPase